MCSTGSRRFPVSRSRPAENPACDQVGQDPGVICVNPSPRYVSAVSELDATGVSEPIRNLDGAGSLPHIHVPAEKWCTRSYASSVRRAARIGSRLDGGGPK